MARGAGPALLVGCKREQRETRLDPPVAAALDAAGSCRTASADATRG